MVKSSSEALLRVINDILDFSKIEAGMLQIEKIPFNLSRLVGETLKLLAVRAHAKQIELVCDIDPEVPLEVIGDSGRLRQILMNLIGNAIKFTEQGEVVLQVGLVKWTPLSRQFFSQFKLAPFSLATARRCPGFYLGLRYPFLQFKTAVWQAQARQAEGLLLWVSAGGSCGDVGKLGVLRACPHVHSDPPLIHQVARREPSRSGFLVFRYRLFLYICR